MTAPTRLLVMCSPRKKGARRMVQAGIVNSSANTVASGSKRRLDAQRYWEVKWIELRKRCKPRRRSPRVRPSSGRKPHTQPMIARPIAARDVSISMMVSAPARLRIEIAITQNDSSVPVIQRTTRVRSRTAVTSQFHGYGVQHRDEELATGDVYSASGWFSGRAASKAGSLAQATSHATIFGN